MVNPSPTRIRDRIAAAIVAERARPGSGRASEGKLVAGLRATEVGAALTDIVTGTQIVRGDLTIQFQDLPKFIFDKQNNLVGIDALVRAYRNGVEQQIDPHRICINPPTQVPDGNGIYTENPREAYLYWLEESIARRPNPAGWNTHGTVITIYSDTVDGYIESSDTSTYSLARAGTGDSIQADDASTWFYVGQLFGELSLAYSALESFVSFDTSPIPDGAIISVVDFSLVADSNAPAVNFICRARTKDWGASLTTADWVAGASLSALTLLAEYDTASGWVADSTYTFTESGNAFKNAIDKTGSTRFLLCSSRTETGNTPTNDERILAFSADQSGTSSDPKLDITYSEPSATLTGTTVPLIYKADVVAGGKTTIITLTADTWVASGATFNAQRSAILQGFNSDRSGGTEWNAKVRDVEGVSAVVRTSDTVVTITWTAHADYDPTAIETITDTIPGAALTGSNPIVATPTFQVALDLATNTPRLDSRYSHFWGGR
mgnify:CR=1 FL=1